MKGIIYWHPGLYRLALKIIYRKSYKRRFDFLAKEIGKLKVLDIGCGDCQLHDYLEDWQYTGVDLNKNFVKNARKRGVEAQLMDVLAEEIPISECILISGVLNQLYPLHEEVLRKILKSATKKVIIAESMRHTINSKSKIVYFLMRILEYPGYDINIKKLNKEELFKLYKKYNPTKVLTLGRDSFAIFDK